MEICLIGSGVSVFFKGNNLGVNKIQCSLMLVVLGIFSISKEKIKEIETTKDTYYCFLIIINEIVKHSKYMINCNLNLNWKKKYFHLKSDAHQIIYKKYILFKTVTQFSTKKTITH